MTDDIEHRASRKGVSQTKICAATLAVIDEEGLPALNMRRPGAAPGVDAMALCRHLPNKQAILAGVVDLVLADLSDDSSGDVRERAHRFFASLRDILHLPGRRPNVASSAPDDPLL
jgi:hypothetical protein